MRKRRKGPAIHKPELRDDNLSILNPANPISPLNPVWNDDSGSSNTTDCGSSSYDSGSSGSDGGSCGGGGD